MLRAPPHRFSLYVLLNVAFALVVGVAYAASGYPNPRLLHLVLLFALCSSSVIDFDQLNGRYALLGLFMLVYFVSYGVGDLSNLLIGSDLPAPTESQPVSNLLSKTEAVILAGGAMLVLGYRVAILSANSGLPARSPREWPKSAILIVGLILWVIGTIATYRWDFYIVPDTTNESVRKGLASISPVTVTLYLLGQMCQPLGILLLAYAYRVFRSPYLVPAIVAVVVFQLFLGFVVDVKGVAMLGMLLVIVTSVLINGKLPRMWLAAFALFVIVLFPFFQAYRGAIHGNVARTAVVENFGDILQKTIAAKDRVNSGRERAQTFLERASVKGSVGIIVENAGNGVDFRRGYTLWPVLAAFIPKVLWSDKPSVPTGQLFNRDFHITDNDDIYISPSHLGELYWNFGWPGVILGMAVIGLICGWVGARFNLAEFTTLTRVLVSVITIRQLIVSFESSISDCYVVWLRSLVGIGLLHVIFARVPAKSHPIPAPPDHPGGNRLFPHLLT